MWVSLFLSLTHSPCLSVYVICSRSLSLSFSTLFLSLCLYFSVYALHRLLLPPSPLPSLSLPLPALPAPPRSADAIAFALLLPLLYFLHFRFMFVFRWLSLSIFFNLYFLHTFAHTHTKTHAHTRDINIDLNQQITSIFTVVVGCCCCCHLTFLFVAFVAYINAMRDAKKRAQAALGNEWCELELATSPASSKHVQTVCTPFVYWELWYKLALLTLTCSHTHAHSLC